MRRLIEPDLFEWKQNLMRRPLFLRGAPRVGKTWLLRELAKNHFQGNLMQVDCANEALAQNIFGRSANLGGAISGIELSEKRRVEPGKTLLVIDNVHLYPEALRAIKTIAEERPALHIAVAGVLTDQTLKKFQWIPQHYQFLDLYPLCFAEFLDSLDLKEAAKIVLSAPREISELMHKTLMKELRNFFLVGGMPQSVDSYRQTRALEKTLAIQRELCTLLRTLDYGPLVPKECVDTILRTVSRGSGDHSDFSKYSDDFSMPTIKHTFDILTEHGVARRVMPSAPDSVPATNHKVKTFKTILLDIGLLQNISGLSDNPAEIPEDIIGIYEGALAEQFVGQEMLMTQPSSLVYWASSVKGSRSRVSYLATVGGGTYPVLVGKPNMARSMDSLDVCLGSYPQCAGAMIFTSSPFKAESSSLIREFPYYYAFSATGGYTKFSSL